ncbi:MAG: hypothetical protein HQ557_03550 [Bacteroidetes bacterium]|nr:hypothetical protein [Bacteroidota bacterium]
MLVNKKILDSIERVYATAVHGLQKPEGLIVASEGFGECKYYKLSDHSQKVIHNNPGGTTDLCPHPTDENVFFAISNFIPVFAAEKAELVYVKRDVEGEWWMHSIETIPFLHRMDIFSVGSNLYFIGATLCGSKERIDDWSQPGKIIMGNLDPETFELTGVRTIMDGLYRNHGFSKIINQGKDSYLISSDSGCWIIPLPDDINDGFSPYKLFDFPASDMAVFDIDDDGDQEFAVITPFHGNQLKILKNIDGHFSEIYSREIEFGHVLWGGLINTIPSFILGYRKDDMKLLILRSGNNNEIEEFLIDADCGPSQISCFQESDGFNILSANRKTGKINGEVALYTIVETVSRKKR